MVNASLNWASTLGLLIFLWGIPAAILGIAQLFFVLNKTADNSTAIISKAILIIFQSMGRILLPIAGSILFFQGWRLDPILQLAFFVIGLSVILESALAIINDYRKWRLRTGRAQKDISI
tara:strand:- start:44 stop:403 length:360 start_codon:yes stop_codon:yes gene_type:complete